MKRNRMTATALCIVFAASLLAGCNGKTDSAEVVHKEEFEQCMKEYLDKNLDGYLDKYFGGPLDENYGDLEGEEEMGEEPERKEFGSLKSFQADQLGGGKFTQEDFAKHDVTVINFWSTLCGPCIDELSAIAGFAEKLPGNVRIITVCLDTDAMPGEAEDILEKAGYKGITLTNGDGDFKAVCDEIQYTPTTIFVDKEGNTIGEAITYAPENLEDTYMQYINGTLKTLGKPEISIEKNKDGKKG